VLLAQPLPQVEKREQHKRDLRSEESRRRGFVCHALAQFRLPDVVLPALLKAAAPQPEKDEDAVRVRAAALQSIGILADNSKATQPLKDPKAVQLMLLASNDPEPIVAKAGAFGLGVLGGPEAIKQLKKLVVQNSADIQYNAALGLARHGDPSGLDLIKAMINPADTRGLDDPEDQKGLGRQAKKARLQLNGLRAVQQLAEAKVDVSSLVPVIKELQAANPPDAVASEAILTLHKVGKY
jgi:HEAT repeat protein